MAKYNIPKRKYSTGEKKMVSYRLSKKLLDEIEELAKDYQWNVTDLIQTALDEFVQWAKKQDSRK